MKTMLLVGGCGLALGWGWMGCLTSGGPSRPTIQEISQAAAELEWQPPLTEELVRIRTVNLSCLRVPAVEVAILGRVPERHLILVRLSTGWQPVAADKELVPNWKVIMERVLLDADCRRATPLARDLTRLLVDPDPNYGRVLFSVNDIPKAREEDDDGKTTPLLGHEIAPLEMRAAGGGRKGVRFTTWNYFGGDVRTWEVLVAPRPTIDYVVLAVGVGDFGFYH